MKCHYCGEVENLEKSAYVGDKVYEYFCTGCEKVTSVSVVEKCLDCGSDFNFLFDRGWNENIICWPCQKKMMKEFFEDPEFKEALKKEIQKPNPFIFPSGNEDGFYIPVPLKKV